jgi:hypothetical protein
MKHRGKGKARTEDSSFLKKEGKDYVEPPAGRRVGF